MKNKRRSGAVLAALVLSMLSTAPVHANVEGMDVMDVFPEVPGSVSYVIDFFDQDGELLDSRICTYGERLEDIITPVDKEEGACVYRFTGWEPELSEVVTDSVAYMAVYEKIGGTEDSTESVVSGAEIKEPDETATKTTSDAYPGGVERVSSTSYDVTPFHIETPTKVPEIPEERPDVEEEETSDVYIPETVVSENMPRPDRATKTKTVENDQVMERISVDIPESLGGLADIEIPDVDLSGVYDIPAVSVGAVPESRESVAEPERKVRETEVPSASDVERSSAAGTTVQDVERMSDVSPKSFPLPQFLLGAVLVSGAAWVGKRRAYNIRKKSSENGM